MSKKEETTPVNNPMGMFGDMSMLREIIMGPKVIEYEQRFTDTDESTKQRFEALERDMNARFEALTKEMNNRFESLTQLLNQNVEKLDTEMKNMSRNDKVKMSELLVEMSKKLVE
jgi:phosphoribosylamine-glycine ligase